VRHHFKYPANGVTGAISLVNNGFHLSSTPNHALAERRTFGLRREFPPMSPDDRGAPGPRRSRGSGFRCRIRQQRLGECARSHTPPFSARWPAQDVARIVKSVSARRQSRHDRAGRVTGFFLSSPPSTSSTRSASVHSSIRLEGIAIGEPMVRCRTAGDRFSVVAPRRFRGPPRPPALLAPPRLMVNRVRAEDSSRQSREDGDQTPPWRFTRCFKSKRRGGNFMVSDEA
jgi:hypothetical protein